MGHSSTPNGRSNVGQGMVLKESWFMVRLDRLSRRGRCFEESQVRNDNKRTMARRRIEEDKMASEAKAHTKKRWLWLSQRGMRPEQTL